MIRMRLAAYLRTQIAVVPLLAALAVLSVLYGGGQARAAEAYGMSAIVLFPVFAWQVKILLDVEPDVQRHIAITVLGSRHRELVNGLLAGAATTSVTVLLGMVLPWAVGGVSADEGLALTEGLWVHLLAVPPAVALGAMASRAISRTPGAGAMVLATGAVLAIVLGLKGFPAPWLAPPLMSAARYVNTDGSLPQALGITAWALAWTAAVLFGYSRLRRARP